MTSRNYLVLWFLLFPLLLIETAVNVPYGDVMHVGIIYDEYLSQMGVVPTEMIESMADKLRRVLCASMTHELCELIPIFNFTVGLFTPFEVCRQIELGVRVVISLTTCPIAWMIESTCSFHRIPHMAIPKPMCHPDHLAATPPGLVWSSQLLPWLRIDPDLLLSALNDIGKMVRITKLIYFTDGISDLPIQMALKETMSLLANKQSLQPSMHQFHLEKSNSSNTSMDAIAMGQSLPLRELLKTLQDWFQLDKLLPIPNNYIIFALNSNLTAIVEQMIEHNLINRDIYWYIGEQLDVAPTELVRQLQMKPRQGVGFRGPNVAFFRQMPLAYRLPLTWNRRGVDLSFALSGRTDKYPERIISAAYLLMIIARMFILTRKENPILLEPKLMKCGLEPYDLYAAGETLRNGVLEELKQSGMNDRLSFYASNTFALGHNLITDFSLMATYDKKGFHLTRFGNRVQKETGLNGLFPNQFRGLYGRQLRIGVVLEPAFISALSVAEDRTLSNATGLLVDIMALLERQFNFTSVYFQSSDGEYGARNDNGTWTGLIGDLLKDEIDLAAGPLSMNQQRIRVVRYLGPFMFVSTGMTTTMLDMDNSWFKMLRPFHYSVWIVIIVSILLSGFTLFFINNMTPFSACNLGLEGANTDEVSLAQNIWAVLESFLLQGCEFFPLALSSRTVIILIWVVIVVIQATWQADMTAFFTRSSIGLTVDSLTDLANNAYYLPIAVSGSSIIQDFHDSIENPVSRKIYEKLISAEKKVNTAEEAIELIKSNPRYIFIHDLHTLRYIVTQNCETLQLLELDFEETPAGFVVTPGRVFEEAFRNYLIRLQETGSIQRLYQKWWFATKICNANAAQYNPMDVPDTAGGVIILGGAAIVAVIGLLAELLYHRKLRAIIAKRRQRKVSVAESPQEGTGIGSSILAFRRGSNALDALPENLANEFRYGGRRRATCAHNAVTVEEHLSEESSVIDFE